MIANYLHWNTETTEQPERSFAPSVTVSKNAFTDNLEDPDQSFSLSSKCTQSGLYSQVFRSRQSSQAVVTGVLIQGHSSSSPIQDSINNLSLAFTESGVMIRNISISILPPSDSITLTPFRDTPKLQTSNSETFFSQVSFIKASLKEYLWMY